MSLILDGSNGVSDIDGTAATPAIRGTDANTGIFFPAADTIAFSEGGTEAMRINSSGNVQLSIANTSILNSSGSPILRQTGSILQVVNVQYSTGVATTSTSYVDTGLSASITPTSASNKILVIVSQTLSPVTTSSSTFASVRLMRDASQIWQDARANGTGQFVHTTPSVSVLDSPATTSSVTYKTQFATGNSSFTMEAQHANLRTSTITLLEIAA
jgi:hypothetical protein